MPGRAAYYKWPKYGRIEVFNYGGFAMNFRARVVVLLALFLSFCLARAALSQEATQPAEAQSPTTPQRLVVFETFMRDV